MDGNSNNHRQQQQQRSWGSCDDSKAQAASSGCRGGGVRRAGSISDHYISTSCSDSDNTISAEAAAALMMNMMSGSGSSAAAGGATGSAGGGGGGGGGAPAGPCGACKFLRRKCVKECIFAPHFGSEQGAARFAAVHKVFGASNVSKLLHRIPSHKRPDAVHTITYEAQARISDPVYGCISEIFRLQQQVENLQAQLLFIQTQLANSRQLAAVSMAAMAIQQQQHQPPPPPLHNQQQVLPSTCSFSLSPFDAHVDTNHLPLFVPPIVGSLGPNYGCVKEESTFQSRMSNFNLEGLANDNHYGNVRMATSSPTSEEQTLEEDSHGPTTTPTSQLQALMLRTHYFDINNDHIERDQNQV